MCKKDKKMVITGTNKEISLGDEITYAIKVTFKRYPDLVFESEYTYNVDEETLKSLIEEELITVEEKPKETYLDYLKWLADKEGFKYTDVLTHFNFTLDINPMAALSILLKAISRRFLSKNCPKGGFFGTPVKVWIFNTTIGKPAILDITKDTNLKGIAYFLNKEDLDKALELAKPILERVYGKQEN